MQGALDIAQGNGEDEQLELGLGYDIIRSYKRLSYTAWHALAEFVDNSTQSYFNNRAEIDAALERSGDKMYVGLVYGREEGIFRISDNSVGMSLTELRHALQIGLPPADPTGRCRYGMGMKTAACWLGNKWSVRTTKLGDPLEHYVLVDVEAVARGGNRLVHTTKAAAPEAHHTIIEIWDLNQKPQGRTVGKIKDFLRSMYRHDLQEGVMRLEWQGEVLEWADGDDQFLQARDGRRYKKTYDFTLPDGRRAWGWLGVLDKGSRAKAGFAILHSGRVVRGWPDSWRPGTIYGQEQGSNDLVNQRVVGEVNLDDFEVTHTKDDILWMGAEEDVQEKLREIAAEYIEVAKKRRKKGDSEKGPSEVEMQAALDEFGEELSSPELADLLTLTDALPAEAATEALRPVLESIGARTANFDVVIGKSLQVTVYLANDLSLNDPYVAVDTADPEHISIVLNTNHPFMEEISGAEGFLNYLREATYDAVSEWRANQQAATLEPDTIKLIKDSLLRLPAKINSRTEDAI